MKTRDRRALLLGGATILCALLVMRGVPWTVGALRNLRDRATEQGATATRARAVLANQSAIRDSLTTTLSRIVALAPFLVDGHSSAEAQATLSGLLTLAANRHGLKVIGLDPLPDSAVGVFMRVALHAELEGDMAGVAGLLRVIETGEPLLSVMALAASSPDPYPHANAAEALRLECDVSGYYLPRGHP